MKKFAAVKTGIDMVTMQTYKNKSEWLIARGKTIGGSDASTVFGENKYKSNVELWQEKMGFVEPEDISDKEYVKYGIDMESTIREMFRLHHPELAVGYEENNMWTNSDYKFAHASLDGWLENENGQHGILEIKTFDVTDKNRAAQWYDRDTKENCLPQNYYIQLLHYLLVTEFDFAILCAELRIHRMDGTVEYHVIEREIQRSEVENDIEELKRKELSFWWHIEDGTMPPTQLPNI